MEGRESEGREEGKGDEGERRGKIWARGRVNERELGG
jgi:hypothetical protein